MFVALYSAIAQRGYRARRFVYADQAAELGLVERIPRRKRRAQHPPPGSLDLAADEADV